MPTGLRAGSWMQTGKRPEVANRLALTMRAVPQAGATQKRALAGVISASPVSCFRRKLPPASGMALNTQQRGDHEPLCQYDPAGALAF